MLIAVSAAALFLSSYDPDAVVTTAPRTAQAVPLASQAELEASLSAGSPSTTVQSATPHGLSTAEQISNWIGQGRSERPASDQPWADTWQEAGQEVGPRKMRGELSVGVGTEGYRDYGAAVELPIGENGTLNLSVRKTENSLYAPYDYGYGPYGYDPMGTGRPFGILEPPGFEGRYWRGRSYSPYDYEARPLSGKSTSASIGLKIGQ